MAEVLFASDVREASLVDVADTRGDVAGDAAEETRWRSRGAREARIAMATVARAERSKRARMCYLYELCENAKGSAGQVREEIQLRVPRLTQQPHVGNGLPS